MAAGAAQVDVGDRRSVVTEFGDRAEAADLIRQEGAVLVRALDRAPHAALVVDRRLHAASDDALADPGQESVVDPLEDAVRVALLNMTTVRPCYCTLCVHYASA